MGRHVSAPLSTIHTAGSGDSYNKAPTHFFVKENPHEPSCRIAMFKSSSSVPGYTHCRKNSSGLECNKMDELIYFPVKTMVCGSVEHSSDLEHGIQRRLKEVAYTSLTSVLCRKATTASLTLIPVCTVREGYQHDSCLSLHETTASFVYI